MSTYKNNNICVFALLTFMIFPLLGISIMLLANLSHERIDKFRLLFFFVLLACYLGVINATKIPISDQWYYWQAYKEVPKMGLEGSLHNVYSSFYFTTATSTKDMGFGLLNYIGYYLTLGCYPLFILVFTAILYYCLFYAIFKYFTYLFNDLEAKQRILSGVVTIAFFTQFFNLTIHLQRQEIATSFIVLAMVLYIVRGQRNWLLICLAISLHTSVIMFFPIFFTVKLVEHKSKKWLVYFILCVSLVFLTLTNIAQYFLNAFNTDSSVVINRLANMGNSEEERMSMGIVLFMSLPMLYISIKRLFFQQQVQIKRERIMLLFYIVIMIFVFITPDNTMQYRFFMMTYIYIPFILPLLLKNTLYDRMWLTLLPFIMVLRFFFTFENVAFEYASIDEIIFYNPLSLLLYRT